MPFSTRNVAYRNDDGTIRFQGAVQSGTSDVLFNLPNNLLPTHSVWINVDLCGAQQGHIFMQAGDPGVHVEAFSSFGDAQCFTSLEGVSFSFGQ
jgi:hypothetical protein